MILDEYHARLKDLCDKHAYASGAYAEALAFLQTLQTSGMPPADSPNLPRLQLALPGGSIVPLSDGMLDPEALHACVADAAAFLSQQVAHVWQQIREVGESGWQHCEKALADAAKAEAAQRALDPAVATTPSGPAVAPPLSGSETVSDVAAARVRQPVAAPNRARPTVVPAPQ